MKKRNDPVRPETAEQLPHYHLIFTQILLVLTLSGVLLARLHVEQLYGQSLSVFSHQQGIFADWFLYCKETLYALTAGVVCCYAVGERIFPDTVCCTNPLYRRQAVFPVICLAGYCVLTCLSGIVSQHKEVVLHGSCTEYEGLLAIFAYCVLFLSGFNYVSNRPGLHRLCKTVLCFGGIFAILAVLEYAFVPLMELPFMKYLIAPPRYRDAAATLRSANSFRETVMMFYNSNYAGAFFAMLLPFPVCGFCIAKRPVWRISMTGLFAALIAAVIMSNATAAFYCMAFEILLILLVLAVKRMLRLRPILAAVGIFLVLALGVDLCTGKSFSRTFLKSIINSGTYSAEKSFHLKEVRISGKTLYLAGDHSGYLILPPYESGSSLRVLPDSGTDCSLTEETQNHLVIGDKASGAAIICSVQEGILYVDGGYDSTLDFAVTTDGLQLISQNGMLLPEIPTAPMADSPLTKYYSLFTGRGYIWVNSLPILKECLLLGKGAGNFPFYFTQNDVVGLCNTDGTYRLVIDKPHSMYLQIAVSSGIPALLCLLVLFGSFLLRGAVCLLRAERSAFREKPEYVIFLCLYTAVCGFMIGGLVNDSCITVSPVFWLLFGTAYSLCITLKKGKTV